EFKITDDREKSKPEEKQEKSKILNSLKQWMFTGEKKTTFSETFGLIQSNSITLRNLIVAVSTYGLERLLNAKAFNCPEENYKQYGYVFLFAPVVILFCLNLLVIGEIWKLSSRMCIKRYRRRGDRVARVLPSLLKACVGPAVWLIVAFLEEDYYLCAKLGSLPSRGNRTSEQKVVEYKSQSHVLAWGVLVAIVILGTAMIVLKNCYLKDNLLMENLYAYERREALSAMKTFTEHMGGSLKDAKLDNDPKTSEYGSKEEKYYSTNYSSQCCLTCYDFYGSKEEKVILYDDGIPEKIGKKTVEKLFEGYEGGGWYYTRAYEDFKNMYPRISTGSPFDPWRMVEGDHHDKRTDSVSCGDELKPLQPTAVTKLIGRPLKSDDEAESMMV
ncbi:unnamed protein product, partial [Porites evermanni]